MSQKKYILNCQAITGAGGKFIRFRDDDGKLAVLTSKDLGETLDSHLDRKSIVEYKPTAKDLKEEYARLGGEKDSSKWSFEKVSKEIETLIGGGAPEEPRTNIGGGSPGEPDKK